MHNYHMPIMNNFSYSNLKLQSLSAKLSYAHHKHTQQTMI